MDKSLSPFSSLFDGLSAPNSFPARPRRNTCTRGTHEVGYLELFYIQEAEPADGFDAVARLSLSIIGNWLTFHQWWYNGDTTEYPLTP